MNEHRHVLLSDAAPQVQLRGGLIRVRFRRLCFEPARDAAPTADPEQLAEIALTRHAAFTLAEMLRAAVDDMDEAGSRAPVKIGAHVAG